MYWQVWVVCVLLLLLGSTGDAGLSQRKSFPAEIETTLNESRPFFLFFLHRNRKLTYPISVKTYHNGTKTPIIYHLS